ncbi:MAG: Lrp/AsnC family transcriptional regulator [Promethearchaeota archaeon]
MDSTDFKIIRELQEDGRKKFSKIGQAVGLSRVAVAVRVKRLVESKNVRIHPEINLKSQNMIMALILIESADEKKRENILSLYSGCPRVILFGTAYGHYDIFALVFAENSSLLEILLTSCMLKNIEGINKSSIMIIGDLLVPSFLPVKKYLADKTSTVAPCGLDCSKCDKFRRQLCIACPSTSLYKGEFFNLNKRKSG